MAPNLHLAVSSGGVVNGNGNIKKKRRRLIIWGSIGLAIVLLIAVGVFAAKRGGERKGHPNHQGRSEVQGQRHCEKAPGGLRRSREKRTTPGPARQDRDR